MSNLFSPMYIGNLRLKNRLAMAPMHTNYEADGSYTLNAIRYFEERAKGGVGLVMTGANVVSTKYDGKRPSPEISSLAHVERMAMLVDRVHAYGAKVCFQLSPGAGRVAVPNPANPPYSASEIEEFWAPMIKCQVLSVEDIHYLADRVGVAAWLVNKAGGDMVELHAYGGYLLDQFMSSQWNHRTDEYGGSLDNRMRFPLECIAAIRKYTNGKMPISVKFTADQGIPGFRTLDEGIQMAKIFEEAGVDILHCDRGVYEAWYQAIPTVYQKHAYNVEMIKKIKASVSIPVMGHGKLFDPSVATSMIEDDICDIIALGHQEIADPYWPEKVKKGNIEDIVPCIGCNECLNSAFNGTHPVCSVNPTCFEEDTFALPETQDTHRNVLIVGAGPGGMEAAITAAKRGYHVEVWEKKDRVGGNLWGAGTAPFKHDVLRLITYYETQMKKLGVQVVFHKEATAEEILANSYDKVILSTGAHSFMPPIKGIEHAKESLAYLEGKAQPGKHVVVIGGGLVGCETACFMAEKAEDVTIVEMLPDILKIADHCKNNDQALRAMIDEKHIQKVCGVKVVEIKEDGIIYQDDQANLHTLPCDTVIIASGFRSNNQLIKELDGKIDFDIVGDANRPTKIINAVKQGYHAIRTMK